MPPLVRPRTLWSLLVALVLALGVSVVAAPAHAVPGFGALGTPLVSGVPHQGSTLTVIAGAYTEQPDGFDYQWYADGAPVGTSIPIYRPTADDIGAAISVQVTAHLTENPDVVTTSAATVAVLPGGTITTWGWDPGGEGAVPDSLSGKTAVAVAAGRSHFLAVTSDGQVTAWGSNNKGQAVVPDSLSGKTVVDVAANGDHSLALTSDGQVTAWGDDSSGASTVPDSLSGKVVIDIAAGDNNSMALTSDGQVTSWGGPGLRQVDVPVSLAGKSVVGIALGVRFAMALTSDGKLTTWGIEGAPTLPEALSNAMTVAGAVGTAHLLAVTDGGVVYGWGNDQFGQSTVPDSLSGQSVVALAAGFTHSLALTADGQITAWGNTYAAPVDPPDSLAGRMVVAIAAGGLRSLAIVSGVPLEIAAPTITGQAKVGQTLTCESEEPDATFAWSIAGEPVGDAAAYDVQPGDLGDVLTCTVTVDREGYDVATASVDSAAVGLGAAGSYDVTLSGGATVGKALRAKVADLPVGATVTWQWFRGAKKVAGATTARYELGFDDYGARMRAVATVAVPGFNDATAAGTSDQVGVADLTLDVDPGRVRAGAMVTITVSNLLPGERWTLGFGRGTWSVSGKAPAAGGTMTRQVRMTSNLVYLGNRRLVISTTNPAREASVAVVILR